MDIAREIKFKTARSGGKGGQNVNKVETMVEAYWNFQASSLVTDEQKATLQKGLENKLTADGLLMVKSQSERTQLGNKEKAIEKMTHLVAKALIVKKKRRPTKPNKAVKEKRLESKKKAGEIKQSRMKVKF